LAFHAGDPAARLRPGRDPASVLDDQVPLSAGRRLEALAELPRMVLEPRRLVPGEAGVPAPPVGPAHPEPAHQPGARRLPRRRVLERAVQVHQGAERRPALLYPTDERDEALRARG